MAASYIILSSWIKIIHLKVVYLPWKNWKNEILLVLTVQCQGGGLKSSISSFLNIYVIV